MNWDGIYSRLSYNKSLLDMIDYFKQPEYLPFARILRAFNFSYASDLYGDIPYSQALGAKSGNNSKPAYDRQQDIYVDLVKELREANDQLAAQTKTINGKQDPCLRATP